MANFLCPLFLLGLCKELVLLDPGKGLVQLLVLLLLVLLDVVACCISLPPNAAFKKMFSPKSSMIESSV